MRVRILSRNSYAVSELVGGIILIAIAVLSFVAIKPYVFPDLPPIGEKIDLIGYVDTDGDAVLEHEGGKSISDFRIIVRSADDTLISTKDYINVTPAWKIGECRYPLEDIGYGPLVNETDMVKITVVLLNKDGTSQEIFDGILSGKVRETPPATMPMLISSLRTNSVDEDLICHNYTIKPAIKASTYIYNWLVDDVPIMNLLMPFDTNSSSVIRDYSGNQNNGTKFGPTWTSSGIVGGAYQFDGVDDHITLPYCFGTNFINDITVEGWIKTASQNGVISSYNRNKYWELGVNNGKIVWSTNAADCAKDTNGSSTVNNGNWHYVAATYKSSTGESTIYIDGKQDIKSDDHEPGELLGTGEAQQGWIGTGPEAARTTIFSTSFETQDEINNWSVNNSGATDIKDYVDNNVSNVDGSADKGTETNFTNAQGTSLDGNVMTIKETDQDAGTSTLGKTSGSGSSYNSIGANQMYGQVFTATSSGEIYQATFYGRSSSGTINAKIVICNSTGYILTNGVSGAISISTTAGNKVGTWPAGSRPIVQNGQTYWIMAIAQTSSIRLYYDATTGGTSKIDNSNSYSSPTDPTDATSGTTNYRVLYADINNLNYQIDFEYQWTAAVYNMTNEQVCIYVTSHTGTENLLVNYWTGSAWSLLGTITGTGWSNFTAAGLAGLTSSNYTIQLKGASESSDSSQDSWNIDAIFLHLWTDQGAFNILPSTTLTPHIGSYSIGGSGDFDPGYASFNRTGIDISSYKDVQVSIWYSYKNTMAGDFLGLYYRYNNNWIPIFEIITPQQSTQASWVHAQANLPSNLSTLQLQFKWMTSSTRDYVAIDDLEITGIPLNGEVNFTGLIDEFKIYNHALSAEQIYQNYLDAKYGYSDKSVIVSEEITLGDIWKCIVTPNDGTMDDTVVESNIVQIISYGGGD